MVLNYPRPVIIKGMSYIFAVGTIQPRKNYDRLVEALSRLNRPDLHLVIAGVKGWLDTPLYEQIQRLGMTERVHFLGYVPDEDLPALACVEPAPDTLLLRREESAMMRSSAGTRAGPRRCARGADP